MRSKDADIEMLKETRGSLITTNYEILRNS
jgi:hypothetical protein